MKKLFIFFIIFGSLNLYCSEQQEMLGEALSDAVRKNKVNIITMLLEQYPNIDAQEALMDAYANHNFEIVKLILSKNVIFDIKKILNLAVIQKNPEIVRLILNKNPILSAKEIKGFLESAIMLNELETIKLFLAKYEDIDIDRAMQYAERLRAINVTDLLRKWEIYKEYIKNQAGREQEVKQSQDALTVHLPQSLAGLTTQYLYPTFDEYNEKQRRFYENQ